MAQVMIMNKTAIHHMVENIAKVIVGKDDAIALICMALACDGHILIEDVPGTGKTTLAMALAKTISGSSSRISCTPDIMPSDIVGFSMYNPKTQAFELKTGAIVSNVFLADEINRTPPKTQSGLLEAMEERQVTIDGHAIPLPKPFFVIATQNPVEYLGTYPLPEAQLDRFLIKVTLGYPHPAEEVKIIDRFTENNPLDDLDAVMSLEDVIALQAKINQIRLKQKVKEYIVNLVQATRQHDDLVLGLSPRATLYISKMARAQAYYQGRDYVTPDDVKAIFVATCAHRLVTKSEAKYQNITAEDILKQILTRVVVQG